MCCCITATTSRCPRPSTNCEICPEARTFNSPPRKPASRSSMNRPAYGPPSAATSASSGPSGPEPRSAPAPVHDPAASGRPVRQRDGGSRADLPQLQGGTITPGDRAGRSPSYAGDTERYNVMAWLAIARFGSSIALALRLMTPDPGGEKSPKERLGSKPGLSVELDLPPLGRKAQKIDVALLSGTGLGFLPDNLAAGGVSGHGVIAPVDAAGEAEIALLKQWAAYRGEPKETSLYSSHSRRHRRAGCKGESHEAILSHVSGGLSHRMVRAIGLVGLG